MESQPHLHELNKGGKGRPPLLYLKMKKSNLILERKALIMKCLYQRALMQKLGILGILEYSELFHNSQPAHNVQGTSTYDPILV